MRSNSRISRADGVTMVETLVGATILVFGLLALAQLLAVSIKSHQFARNNEEASRLAIAKVEQLEKRAFATDGAIQITPASPNSLDNNVANYFDTPTGGFTRRWRVAAGPTTNTRLVSVRMIPISPDRNITKPLTIVTMVRSW